MSKVENSVKMHGLDIHMDHNGVTVTYITSSVIQNRVRCF